MRWLTRDDLVDVYMKGRQRGLEFLLSKFTLSEHSRVRSAFNATAINSSNWWDIPYVKKRWNRMISGDEALDYEGLLMQEVLVDGHDLKLLSLGSGVCSHEIRLASYNQFKEVICMDLSPYGLSKAEAIAQEKGIDKMKFICADIDSFEFKPSHYDVVLFHSSLHHFKSVDRLLETRIKPCLKKGGLLIINEFVGPERLQFPKHQIDKINEALNLIPDKFKMRLNSTILKRSFSGSGLWRMIMADPSECIDSASIIPSIHKHFETVIEKPYGGNILMNVLKDIAHHFIDLDEEKRRVLDSLFDFEDEYLKNESSDFVFGVYRK